MKLRLSKFVGRDQLPSDRVAFERISRAFAPANTQGPAATQKVMVQRRTRKVSQPLASTV